MSAKIYSLPKDLIKLIPDPFSVKNYEEAETEFLELISKKFKERNRVGDQKYIGETIRFQVADGYAIYMVASLKPLSLIHLPLLDGYEANDVDLMTVKRVKDKIDGEKKLLEFFKKQSQATVDECDEAVKLVGLKVSDMSMNEFKKLYNSNETWRNKHQLILYNGVEYLIPNYGSNEGYEHRVYKYLCNNFRKK